MPPGLDSLKHIVVLMMCNRSFDHMLGALKAKDPRIDGLGGSESNRDSAGRLVPVQPLAEYQGQLNPDPDHHFPAVDLQIFNGNTATPRQPSMQGFIKSYFLQRRDATHSHSIMYYFPVEKLPVLTTLATGFAVFNRWFSSIPGPTICNRAFAHYGSSFGHVGMDLFYSDPAFRSIYERMLAAGRTSKIYYYDQVSSTVEVVNLLKNQPHLFGTYAQFLTDCNQGTLPDYSFIEPNFTDHDVDGGLALASDQHPDHNVLEGEIFIATTYNAIRLNQALWHSTALLIVYDLHGGIFDHVAPPSCTPDDFVARAKETGTGTPFAFDRLGIRVPAVLVSPWIPKGTVVSPMQSDGMISNERIFEHASIPATVTNFFLPAFDESNKRSARERNASTFLDLLSLPTIRSDDISFDTDKLIPREPAFGSEMRPVSSLIRAQLRQFKAVEDQLPSGERSGIDPNSIRTEKEAADYIGTIAAKLRKLVVPDPIVIEEEKPVHPTPGSSESSAGGRAKLPAVIRRRTGPSTHLARDIWTVDDSLGHYPYAYGIYRFLTDDDTKPPLAVSIQAPWGGGKTSIMRMIQAQLDPEALRRIDKHDGGGERARVRDVLQELKRLSKAPGATKKNAESDSAEEERGSDGSTPLQVPPIQGTAKRRVTVWFNAWKYESTPQVWSGLADSIVQQVSERLGPVEREIFWFRLQLRRVDANQVRRKVYEQIISTFTETVIPWLWAYIAPPAAFVLLALIAKIQQSAHLEQIGWLGTLASMGTGLLVAGRQAKHAKDEVEKQPARVGLSDFVKPPDYEASLGFVHQVVNDLKKVFELIPEKYRPMVIFIDDLDRCSPNKVADVIEAINLFLAGEFPDCMFLLGIDDEMVAAALDKAHSDVIAKLPAYAKSSSIGWRFMDKFVQLPFVVPPPSEEKLRDYARSLLGKAKSIDMETREQAARLVETSHEPKVVVQQIADEKNLSPSQRDGLEKEVVIIQQMDSDIKAFSDNEEKIASLMVQGAEEFSTSPRDVKRFVNVFRFHYFLRAARETREDPVPTLDQLSRWIIFSLQWPEAIRWLRRSHLAPGVPADPQLEALEKLAKESGGVEDWRKKAAELLCIKAEDKSWAFSEDVMKFFRTEAELPKDERLSASFGKGPW